MTWRSNLTQWLISTQVAHRAHHKEVRPRREAGLTPCPSLLSPDLLGNHRHLTIDPPSCPSLLLAAAAAGEDLLATARKRPRGNVSRTVRRGGAVINYYAKPKRVLV